MMPGIGLRDGFGAVGQGVAGKDEGVVGVPQGLRIEAEFPGKRFVEQKEPRGGDGEWGRARIQQIRQAGEGVVESPSRRSRRRAGLDRGSGRFHDGNLRRGMKGVKGMRDS